MHSFIVLIVRKMCTGVKAVTYTMSSWRGASRDLVSGKANGFLGSLQAELNPTLAPAQNLNRTHFSGEKGQI